GVVAVAPWKLLDGAVGQCHDLDRVRAPAPVMPPLTGLVPLRNERSRKLLVGESAAVGRVNAAERAWHRQRLRKPALQADRPEAEVRLLGGAGASRREDHAFTIGSPPADSGRART